MKKCTNLLHFLFCGVSRFILTFYLTLLLFVGNAQVQFMHYTTEDGLPDNNSEAIFRDSDGYLWVGTYNGLSKYDGYRFQLYPSSDTINGIIGNTVFKIFEDNQHKIWIGSNKGLSLYNKKNDKFINSIKLACVTDIEQDKRGFLWVCSHSGLFVIDPNLNKIEKRYTISNGLSSNVLTSSVIDAENNIWISTQNNGLMEISTLNGKMIKSFPNIYFHLDK